LIPWIEQGIMGLMTSTIQNDPVLRFFKNAIVEKLGGHLRQVLLFGSRARGDATAESDYDLLVVVDHVNSTVTNGIDTIAGQALLEHRAVLSAFPISEEARARRRYSPLLMNVDREGVAV
jgi:uncharacterized protein